MTTEDRQNTIILFDVDGTLSKARNEATQEMRDLLKELRKKVSIGVVGGSDLSKIAEQLPGVVDNFDYVFSENGLVGYKHGKLTFQQSLKEFLGEEKLKQFINFTLHYIADLDIPIKRGTFIEFRNGMINVSPIGRNCTQAEREAYEKYDLEHKIRENMVKALEAKFPDLGLKFAIGGQISFDVFPVGWDKTYCLQHIPEFTNVYFFGDKTFKGGNDYEISNSSRVKKAFPVTNPLDTIRLVKETFLQ